MSAWYAYFILAASWAAYFSFHSLAADLRFKKLARQKLGKLFRLYRLGYNLLSIAGLAGLYWYQSQLYSPFEFSEKISGTILLLFGIIIMLLALRGYNLREFAGLQQERKDQQLNCSGLNGYVRHPLYSGLILLLFSYLLIKFNLPRIISVTCILIYLQIGTRLKEKKLEKIFNSIYKDYKRRTPMFFPFINKKSPANRA